MDEHQLLVRLVGDVTARGIASAIDALARNGVVVDTGERGAWTQRGRLIVWRAVADGRL